MRAGLATIVLAAALASAGCGGGGGGADARPKEPPGHFVQTFVGELYRGETGKAWDLLHPIQQAKVPRAKYVACEREAPLQGTAQRIDVIRVVDVQAEIPGGAGKVPSTAVTFRVLLALPGYSKPQPITHTAHVFNVHGRWAWVIGPNDFPAYAAGICPAEAS